MSRYTSRYVVVVIVVTKWGMISHKYKYKYMLIKTSEQKEPSILFFSFYFFCASPNDMKRFLRSSLEMYCSSSSMPCGINGDSLNENDPT